MQPPRKDLIPNKDNNILSTKKDQSFPPHLENFPPVFKSLINKAHDHDSKEDDCNYSTDTSRNDKEDSIHNMKVVNNKDINDEH